MPSFDIVSKVDLQEVDNALQSVKKEIDQRYDFKGSQVSVIREDEKITIIADDQYKLEQVQSMIKGGFAKRKLDPKALGWDKTESASGNTIRQFVSIKQGVEGDNAKKIVKEIKTLKLKVQASIRGEEVRVEGKKRDDLQSVMNHIKSLTLDLPLQYINFRD